MSKIMVIHHSGDIGGAGVSLFNTIRAIEQLADVVVYCPEDPSKFKDFLISKGIKTKTYNFPLGSVYNFSGGPSICNPTFTKKIIDIFKYKNIWKEIIREESPDLVLVNSKILAWFSIITKKLGIKSICYVRETKKKNPLNIFNYLTKYFLNKFDKVIFISKYDEKVEGIDKEKSVVIPNFVDFDNYKSKKNNDETLEKFNIPNGRFNILFVGGMAKLKGVDIAIKSIAFLKEHEINLIIVGNPQFAYISSTNIYFTFYNSLKRRYERSIEKTILKNGIEDKIFKIGIQHEMVEIYKISDVLIFPATKPHQARPAFEAGSQGKPVIMPDFENTVEYVKDNVNGLIFKKRDARSLANAIKKLIDNPGLAHELGRKNYELTLQNHTREKSETMLRKVVIDMLTVDLK
ncbi:Glycosyltransferase involved in cell wall bisynthesis [Desulfonispora thiosulfatigenes DSM 11270]|uniref:Glycosyltransferase involved in cell wall bisynthesis n=1 Tax=Desulfonispora thiosulfatigenes DSM 11270 TaxID=656914 RepID=A0A1W1V5I5_DESTI|nr:glycosyltransferase family 4 protein [Desulfonispora thiosulfatigenes]SMB88697.1 Glycosyltransferase involved in cell wall bisynthesis [Desulfonispora thiosulfatigenes DSM 11270]